MEKVFTLLACCFISLTGFSQKITITSGSIDCLKNEKVIDIVCGNEVSCITIKNSSANNFWGTDFDTGYRIQECYAKAGRELAKFLI